MLLDWEKKFPGRIESIFSSICNIAGSQLADTKLFDFAGLDGRQKISEMTDVDEDATSELAYVEAAGWGGPNMWFARVPEPKIAKNRMHLDLRAPATMTEEVVRLLTLGASIVERHDGHTVMNDPEGNVFCVELGPED